MNRCISLRLKRALKNVQKFTVFFTWVVVIIFFASSYLCEICSMQIRYEVYRLVDICIRMGLMCIAFGMLASVVTALS